MPDYAEMYRALYRSQTKAIEILQKAQQATEDMYISAQETNIVILDAAAHEENRQDEPQR